MSCGRVETGLGKGGAGGRLLLYKTHRCFLNYVNVFLVKTIKRIIKKKKMSQGSPQREEEFGFGGTLPHHVGMDLSSGQLCEQQGKWVALGCFYQCHHVPGLLSCCPVEMPPCQVPLLHQNQSSPPPLSPGCSQPAICTSYQNPQAAGFNFLLWEGRRGRRGSIK